jgi:hypothetical protein
MNANQLKPKELKLYQYLKECSQEGKLATFKAMKQFFPDIQKSDRCIYYKIEAILKPEGMLCRSVRKKGYRPVLNQKKTANIEGIRFSKVRSQIKKTTQDITSINRKELDRAGTKDLQLLETHLNVISNVMSHDYKDLLVSNLANKELVDLSQQVSLSSLNVLG